MSREIEAQQQLLALAVLHAFSFSLLVSAFLPHPWPPLPIPDSPRMAGDISRAVHDCSLING